MTRLIHAELLKARSIRLTWVIASAAAAFCALWTVVGVLTLDAPNQSGLLLDQRIQNVYQMAQHAYPFTLILGIVAMAGEHRHRTAGWTFLICPRRQQVIAAKLVHSRSSASWSRWPQLS